MAKLDDLFPNFLNMTPEEAHQKLESYFIRRLIDISSPERFIKKDSKRPTTGGVKFTDAEKELMKRLKLRPSDLLKLKNSVAEEEENDDEDELEET
jgi:hypothetical protein